MRSLARVGSPSPPAQGSPGRKNAKNSNIYKLFWEKHAKTTVFIRFYAKTSRGIGIRNEEAGFPWPENFESGDAKSKAGYRKSEISEGHRKSEIRNSATGNQKLETSNKFCNRKSEIMKPGSPNIYETCNCNEIWEVRNRKSEIRTNDSRLRKRLRETHNAKLQIGNTKSET